MSLSSCSNKSKGVSEETVRKDVLTQFNVDGTKVKLNDLKIDSNKIKALHSTVEITVVVENEDAVSTLDVMMYYTYSKNRWAFVSKTVTFLSAVTKTEPDINDVIKAAKTAATEGSYLNAVNTGSFHEDSFMVNTLIKPYPQSGWIMYVFESKYSILDTTAVGTTNIKAKYVYGKGWEYSTDSWAYIETTKLAGDYVYTFGANKGTEHSWFTANQILQVHLEGAMTLTVKNDGSSVYDSTITGTMKAEDKTYPLKAQAYTNMDFAGPNSYAISLIFGSEPDAYLNLILDDGMGHGGEASPARWYGVDAHNNYFGIDRVK